MAKGNMLLGQARGKVGDIVFSRNNGQQVIKARSQEVRNPQTQAQVLQRILLNTVSQAYSKMLAICDHSFEGVKTGQDTMSAFMKRNLSMMRAKVVRMKNENNSLSGIFAVTPIGAKSFALNNYVMSTGSLPPVVVDEINNSNVGGGYALLTVPGAEGEVTYGDFITGFGLNRGDQITFCQLTYSEEQGIQFSYARIILDPVNDDFTPAALTEKMFVDGEVNKPSERNAGSFASVESTQGKIRFCVSGTTPVGVAIIVSRQDLQGNWLRSNAAIQLVNNSEEYGQYALLDAIDLFYSGGISFDSAWYLNNAESGSAVSGGSAAPHIPRLSTLMSGDVTLLSSNTAATIQPGSVPISGTVQYFDAESNSKVIVTERVLSVAGPYEADASDKSVNVEDETFSGNVTLAAMKTYHTYFVSGGYVRTKHRDITTPSDDNP